MVNPSRLAATKSLHSLANLSLHQEQHGAFYISQSQWTLKKSFMIVIDFHNFAQQNVSVKLKPVFQVGAPDPRSSGSIQISTHMFAKHDCWCLCWCSLKVLMTQNFAFFFGCLKKKTMTLRPSIKDARKIQCKTGYIQKWGNRAWMIPLYTSYLYMITWMIPALSSADSIWLFINHPRGHILTNVITENNLFHCYLEAIVEIELEWIKHHT